MTRSLRTTPAHPSLGALLVAVLLVTSVPVARGQDSTSAGRNGWVIGPLLGVPGAGSDYDPSFFTLGVGVTRLSPNRPGLDFAIGTVPRAIPEGIFPIGARIGASIPFSLSSDAFVIPSAGASGIGAVGSGVVGAIGGYYWGAAALVARGSTGFRGGITWHRPFEADASVWLVEVGVMRVPLAVGTRQRPSVAQRH
jgi:hypothetical protein